MSLTPVQTAVSSKLPQRTWPDCMQDLKMNMISMDQFVNIINYSCSIFYYLLSQVAKPIALECNDNN